MPTKPKQTAISKATQKAPRTARKAMRAGDKGVGGTNLPAEVPRPVPTGSSTQLEVAIEPEADLRTQLRRVADNARSPAVRAACTAMPITKSLLGEVDLTQTLESLRDSVKAVQAGEMGQADAMLVSQADTLDSLFHLLVARSSANTKAGLLGAAETYMRLALKAQSQARATWESISKIKNPVGATFVRQANIANGPQQVNNQRDSAACAHIGTEGGQV